MSEAFNPYRFWWWRYNRYEIDDEWIRPAPGAELELYDPWKPYRDSWDYDPDSATPFVEKRLQGPPYLSLLALADEVSLDPDRPSLDKKSADRLLKWCSEFGLLGILPQRVQMVALTPRWLPREAGGAAVGHKLERPKDGLLYPVQFIYNRNNSILLHLEGVGVQGWNISGLIKEEQGQKGKRLGQIYNGKTSMQPGVLIQDMYFDQENNPTSVEVLNMLSPESFQETWSRFFPSIPKKQVETYLYPPPLSPPFWEIYSESVMDFFMGVFALRKALIALNNSSTPFDPQQLSPADESQQPSPFELGFELMNNLVSSSSMVLVKDEDGSYIQEWRAASLLGCFAMMALQDLTQHRKIMNCEKCNRLFVTEAYQARYCSDRCRHTAQKRRYRQKLKEEKDNG